MATPGAAIRLNATGSWTINSVQTGDANNIPCFTGSDLSGAVSFADTVNATSKTYYVAQGWNTKAVISAAFSGTTVLIPVTLYWGASLEINLTSALLPNASQLALVGGGSGGVPTSRSVATGAGLLGGGTLAADLTLTPDFGTGASKVMQGNQAFGGDTTGTVGATVNAKINGTAVPSGPTAGQILAATGAAAGQWQAIPWATDPASQGLLAWTQPVGPAQSNSVLTTGTLYVCKVRADYGAASAVRTIRFTQITDGGTLTLGLCMVFDVNGTKQGADSADQSATWNAGSPAQRAVTVGSFAVTQGAFYYLGILAVGTTGPAIGRGDSAGQVNVGGQTGAARPYATAGTGLSATVASITPSANAQSNIALVMGLS